MKTCTNYQTRFLTTLLLLGMYLYCPAATYQVDTTIDLIDSSPGDGICASVTMQCSLRAAVQESNQTNDIDTILLPAGEFLISLPGIDEDEGASGDLDLLQPVIITGVSAELTRIDGQMIDRVFDIFPQAGKVQTQLSQLTITGGQYSAFNMPSGSALFIHGQDVGLTNVNLTLNHSHGFNSHNTGAIHVEDSCLSGSQVNITHNTGNVIYIKGDQNCLELSEFNISHNDNGSAIYLVTAVTANLRNGLIAHNTGSAYTILLNIGNHVTFENVTISSNEGNGAILNDGGSQLFINQSTITQNIGSNGSPAIVGGILDVHGGSGLVFLTNSIVAGNGPGSVADDISRGNSLNGGNLLGDVTGYAAHPTDELNVKLNLGSLQDLGGFAKGHVPDVLWVDRAIDEFCSPFDQLGNSRPVDGNQDGISQCDAGAVEFNSDFIFIDGFE